MQPLNLHKNSQGCLVRTQFPTFLHCVVVISNAHVKEEKWGSHVKEESHHIQSSNPRYPSPNVWVHCTHIQTGNQCQLKTNRWQKCVVLRSADLWGHATVEATKWWMQWQCWAACTIVGVLEVREHDWCSDLWGCLMLLNSQPALLQQAPLTIRAAISDAYSYGGAQDSCMHDHSLQTDELMNRNLPCI